MIDLTKAPVVIQIPKDMFSQEMVHFPLLERPVALQNMMRNMILRYFIWFCIDHTRNLYGISMHLNVSYRKQKKFANLIHILIYDFSLSMTCIFEGTK